MGRAPCCEKNGLKKGPWTSEEDQKLIDYINKNGYGNWRNLPKNAGLQRCGKSCRLRWTNYLRPDIKRGKFSFEEEEAIIQLHSVLGNKWSAIAARLPGRTDNEIKNYWNTHIRKKLLRMGIDPVTHTPRLDLLDLSTILNSSLYNNSLSQINYNSKLLGIQSLINPDLVRFASTLFSSQRQNQDYLIQNQIINENHQTHDQTIPVPLIQPNCGLDTAPSQTHQFMQYNDVHHFPAQADLSGFGSENCKENGWTGSMLPTVPAADYGYYGSGQAAVDPNPLSETSAFMSNSSNNMSFHESVLSNISSSSTPLNSNSTYNVSGEDDREISYCGNSLLKFEIPDILDVNDFLCN